MADLILIRGIPGSGKSTKAKELIKQIPGAIHVEADMYFVNADGEYNFDAARLGDAHRWCQETAAAALSIGQTAIVSNTFTTIKELRPYFEMCNSILGTYPLVHTCTGNYQNVHGVPAEKLEQMRARFAWDISELFN